MSTATTTARTVGRRPAAAMLTDATRLTGLLASGILAGAVLAIWLLDVELGRSATLFTQYRQATTGPLTRALPPLGGLALLAAVASGVLGRGRARLLALSAAACLLTGLIVTVVVHFPINNAILAWSPAAPPVDWQQVRDRWQLAHAARTLLSVAAFVLLAAGVPRRPGRTGQS